MANSKDITKGQRKAKRFKEKHGMTKSEWAEVKKKLRKEGKAREINTVFSGK